MRFFTEPPSPTTCARPIALRRSVDRGCDARQLSTPLVRHSTAATSAVGCSTRPQRLTRTWAAQPVLSRSARPQPLSPSSAAHPDVGGTPGPRRGRGDTYRGRNARIQPGTEAPQDPPRTNSTQSRLWTAPPGGFRTQHHAARSTRRLTTWISSALSRGLSSGTGATSAQSPKDEGQARCRARPPRHEGHERASHPPTQATRLARTALHDPSAQAVCAADRGNHAAHHLSRVIVLRREHLRDAHLAQGLRI